MTWLASLLLCFTGVFTAQQAMAPSGDARLDSALQQAFVEPSLSDNGPDEPAAEDPGLASALRALASQRPGVVDAYVLSIALDSDAVFGREAIAAGQILARRYDADRRTVVLAASSGEEMGSVPRGSPASLEQALAGIAERMDEQEDVLILFTTSHGTPIGLTYRVGDEEPTAFTPKQLRAIVDRHGIRNRLLIISACHSGIFIPGLQSSHSIILTAAASDRTSFGCNADNDWTFFGDALLNQAFRKPQALGSAFAEASGLIAQWERQLEVDPSQPQIFLGGASHSWLRPLERRMPATATAPTGRPAVETSAS